MTLYRAMVPWRGGEVESLEDIIASDLCVLFVGLNPSPVSVVKGHYHQGILGRQLWSLLEAHGVVPRVTPRQFHDELLLQSGLGITDLVKVPSPRARLDDADVAFGRDVLREKIRSLRPRIVCSIYKSALERLCETKFTNEWGCMDQRIGHSAVFILPFPYRAKDEISRHMQDFKALIESNCHD